MDSFDSQQSSQRMRCDEQILESILEFQQRAADSKANELLELFRDFMVIFVACLVVAALKKLFLWFFVVPKISQRGSQVESGFQLKSKSKSKKSSGRTKGNSDRTQGNSGRTDGNTTQEDGVRDLEWVLFRKILYFYVFNLKIWF